LVCFAVSAGGAGDWGKLVKSLLGTGLSAALTAAIVVATHPPVNPAIAEVGLTALSAPLPATVLTLEGGLVGLQNLVPFTQLQLRGDLCDPPDTCQAVDYDAWPLGQYFNDLGAVRVNEAISALRDDGTPITLFGHSQGGQVIYSALRGWAADPATAPDSDRVSWVSIGNPENAFGGRDPDPIPADSPYQGMEVIRQYDGWADWPTDERNLLAVLNAAVGMSTTHVFGYFDVDLNDPGNVRYTPDRDDGSPGNVTYVFVPNPMLPLVEMTGLLAPLLNPVLDPILRPIVEAGYQRPIGPVGGSAVPAAPAAAFRPAVPTARVKSPAASISMVSEPLEPGPDDPPSPVQQRRVADRAGGEKQRAQPVRARAGASSRAAVSQRADNVSAGTAERRGRADRATD